MKSLQSRLLFQQGPMSEAEANRVTDRYEKRGNEVVVTDSFSGDGQKTVFVYSPKKSMDRGNFKWANGR